MTYLQEVAIPYARQHDLALIELQKKRRDKSLDTIYQRLTRPGSPSIGIPIRLSNGAPGNRTCTIDFKIMVVAQWTKRQGATKENPATVGLGISLDEWHRMRNESGIAHERLAYPLVDLRLDRTACMTIIRDAGLPVPPKSSCWFCPFHTLPVWQAMRHNQPDLFAKAAHLERLLNERRASQGRDQVWLTRKLKPLEQVTTDLIQSSLFDESDICESGYCMV